MASGSSFFPYFYDFYLLVHLLLRHTGFLFLSEDDKFQFLQLSERIYRALDKTTKMLRFTLPFPLLAYPFYLVSL